MAFSRICGMISNKISDKTNSRRKKGTVPFLRVSVGRRGAGLRWRPLHTEVCRSTDRADRRDRRPLRFAVIAHTVGTALAAVRLRVVGDADPYGSHRLVILSEAKNLPWQRENLIRA